MSTSQPNLFDSAITRLPRMRAWRFSSARPGSRPANDSLSSRSYSRMAASMPNSINSIPRFAAIASASERVPSEE